SSPGEGGDVLRRSYSIEHAGTGTNDRSGIEQHPDGGFRVIAEQATQKLVPSFELRPRRLQPDRAVRAFEIRCRRAGAKIHPSPQHRMPQKAVVTLVGVAEERGRGYFAMNDAPRADRRVPDRATHEPGIRANPQRTLEPHTGADLDATLQHDGPVARVEHDARLDRRLAPRDPRRVDAHDRASAHRVGVAERPDQ